LFGIRRGDGHARHAVVLIAMGVFLIVALAVALTRR
jgi:hypothetical protein